MQFNLHFLLPAAVSCLVATANLSAADLQAVVTDTIASNPDVLIAESQRDSVEQQMEQARAGFFPQVDIVSGIGQIQGGLHTCDASANHQNRTDDVFFHGLPLPRDVHKKAAVFIPHIT